MVKNDSDVQRDRQTGRRACTPLNIVAVQKSFSASQATDALLSMAKVQRVCAVFHQLVQFAGPEDLSKTKLIFHVPVPCAEVCSPPPEILHVERHRLRVVLRIVRDCHQNLRQPAKFDSVGTGTFLRLKFPKLPLVLNCQRSVLCVNS